MKPPLARFALFVFGIAALFVMGMTGDAFAATDGLLGSAADVGVSAAHALSPKQLAGVIALGFLPAIYMLLRSRRHVPRHR